MKNVIFHKTKSKVKRNILFLHGYGQTKEMMYPIAKRIKDFANYLIIDLTGYENLKFEKVYNIDDYLNYINKIIERYNFVPDIIVGHSFGGKLASFYALNHDVTLLLLAPSTIKPSFSLKRNLKVILYKIFKNLKRIKIIKNIPTFLKGSRDYQASSGVDRLTFLNIVHAYLDKKDLRKLSNDIYIVYGNNDQEITYKQMLKLKKYSQKSHLIVINGDHFAYLLNVNAIANLLLEIIKEENA